MPPKKHLDGQGRRRNHCRRAVQLSEFLRGDDEPAVQAPVPPTDSQGTTESSIGTIPPTDRSAGCVTVTPVVTPDTTTDEPEKVSLQEETPPSPPPPPPPVNVWQLSSGEKDRPQGTFVPDDKAFPGLGKQGKKFKPLVFPEASRATRSPDSAKARRVCPVLGNFLPDSLFPDKNRTVARWLSSVRSAQDQAKPASGSPSRVTILKRATSQQQPKKGAASKPEISHEPASSTDAAAAVAVVEAVSPMECSDELMTAPQKTLGSCCSEKELDEQMSLDGEEIKPDAAPPVSGNAEPAAMEWEQSQEKEMQNEEKEENRVSSMEKKPPQTPDCFSEHIVAAIQPEIAAAPHAPEPDPSAAVAAKAVPSQHKEQNQNQRQILGETANERETAPPIRHSLLNANAQEFRPRVKEQEREQEPWFPGSQGGGPSGQQLYNSRLKRKRPSQRHTRARGQRELENLIPSQGQLLQQRAIQGQRARPAAGQHHLEQSHRESHRESYRESYRAFPYRAPGAQQRQQQLQQQQHVLQQQQYQQQQQVQQQQRQQYQQQLQQQQQRQHQQQLQLQRQQQQQLQLQRQQQQMQMQRQQQQQQHRVHQQRQHRARAAPRTHSLHNLNLQQNNNQMYPGYVAAPTAYGHPSSATPRYAATPPVYPAQPPAAASLATLEYVTGPETLDYVGGGLEYGAGPPPPATLEYVAPNRYGGGGYAPAIPETEFYPYIWEMQ